MQWRDGWRSCGLCHTGQSQPSGHTAAETENRFAWLGRAGRPAGTAGRTHGSAPKSAWIKVRTENPSALVTTVTSAPSQPSGERRGRCGKQQRGVGQQSPGQKCARERVAGDAPARRHAAAQRDGRALVATTHSSPLPPLVVAEAHSYPPNHGMPGMEPKQPNPAEETASVTGPTTPARCRCYPATRSPPQHTHRLQESEATGAISTSFPISAALAHQHHAQPRDRNEFPRLRDPLKRDCNQKLDLLGV